MKEMINLQDTISDPNISSAEMTAYWRSLYPHISGDRISLKLASDAGIVKAKDFEAKFSYPLVARKVSVRAGFMLNTSVSLLDSGKFDSCISIASGFSMLTYLIAARVLPELPNLTFIDVDLPHILEARNKRIIAIADDLLDKSILTRIELLAMDLEEVCTAGRSFGDLFPRCERPVFIIEGLIYFLSKRCVDWLIREISSYKNVALLFDYWPEDGTTYSACFKRVVDSLKGFMPENVKSFWSADSIATLSRHFKQTKDRDLKSIENDVIVRTADTPMLIDQNEFFPVRFFVGSKVRVD